MTFYIDPSTISGSVDFAGTIDAYEAGGAALSFSQNGSTIGTFAGEAEGISAGYVNGSGTWSH